MIPMLLLPAVSFSSSLQTVQGGGVVIGLRPGLGHPGAPVFGIARIH